MEVSGYILNTIDFVSENFHTISENILRVVILVYIVYGILLAFDAHKRYRSWAAPIIVFLLWVLFSVFFFPIYLLIRPNRTTSELESDNMQNKAILLDSAISVCSGCGELVKNAGNYCYNCGATAHKACPHCDRKLALNWKYCVHCGTKVSPTQSSYWQRLFAKIKINLQPKKLVVIAVEEKRDTPKLVDATPLP